MPHDSFVSIQILCRVVDQTMIDPAETNDVLDPLEGLVRQIVLQRALLLKALDAVALADTFAGIRRLASAFPRAGRHYAKRRAGPRCQGDCADDDHDQTSTEGANT